MDTIARVRGVLERVLGVPASAALGSARLEDVAAIDSLALAELAAGLDEEFAIEVPGDQLTTGLSVPDLVALVEDRLRATAPADRLP